MLQVLAIISSSFAWLGGIPLLVSAFVASLIFGARSIVVNRWWLGVLTSAIFLFQGFQFESDPGVTLAVTRIAGYVVMVTWGVVGWILYARSRVDLPDL